MLKVGQRMASPTSSFFQFVLYFPLNLPEAEGMCHNYSDTHTNTVRRSHVNPFRENYTTS